MNAVPEEAGRAKPGPLTRGIEGIQTADRIWVGDGAMATLLHQRGVPIRTCYEELSVSMPEWVKSAHQSYLAAGVDFVQTNTFGAHRSGLSRYHLETEVVAINRAAAHVARTAVEEAYQAAVSSGQGVDRARRGPARVFGTVGSIVGARAAGMVQLDRELRRDLQAEYEEQVGALLASGVDGIVLETFADAGEMVFAIEVVRALTSLPVLANLSPETIGVTRDGVELASAFSWMRDAGADIVGLNCRLGPAGILRSYEGLDLDDGAPYAASPNAGLLHLEDDDYAYTGSADYFADTGVRLAKRGVRWIGGCCGTTPLHIRKLVERLPAVLPLPAAPKKAQHERIYIQSTQPAASGAALLGDADLTAPTLVDTVAVRTTVIVELDPPRTLQTKRFLDGAQALSAAGADFVTMADNSLGNVRVSNMALAALLKQQGIEPLVHVTCRDRNLVGQQSHLMGLDVLGVRHILLVTGDPTRFGDLPGATSVYDVSSTELTRMVKRLNTGVAFSGASMRHPSKFVVGTSFNPHVANFDRALDRLRRKVDAGADYVMTQPVFDTRTADRIAEATHNLGVPLFLGVMPLVSHRNAQFLHNEVPGIVIPDEIRSIMATTPEDQAADAGLRVAQTLLDEVGQRFRGIYLITPFLRYDLTAHLTAYVKRGAPFYGDACTAGVSANPDLF